MPYMLQKKSKHFMVCLHIIVDTVGENLEKKVIFTRDFTLNEEGKKK